VLYVGKFLLITFITIIRHCDKFWQYLQLKDGKGAWGCAWAKLSITTLLTHHLLGLFLFIPEGLLLRVDNLPPRAKPTNAPQMLKTALAALRASLFTLLSRLFVITLVFYSVVSQLMHLVILVPKGRSERKYNQKY
jgi:hypothetical protein